MKNLARLILIVVAIPLLLCFATHMESNSRSEVLVSTDWVAQHGNDRNVVIIEVDGNIATYHEGHVPGAKNIPWGQACNEDGTFKSVEELHALYAGKGVTADKSVIAYCRIGERSSHTWFVLKYLLGYPNVSN
jgi:3-mercaptopyruvate sulfurtransferase SseA